MSVGQRLRDFHRGRKKYLLTLALVLVAVYLLAFSPRAVGRKGKLDYASSLDQVAAVVNGRELNFRELAFYVAYEEAQVQEQAIIYEPDDPRKYWNARIDKVFIRAAARNAALQMAVHDAVFAELAEADELTLSEEEEFVLQSAQEDFWQDLIEDDRIGGLGVSREDICASMRRAALAQKCQEIYELVYAVDEGAYSYNGKAYEELLAAQDYEIRMDVWKRVDFGNVTLGR